MESSMISEVDGDSKDDEIQNSKLHDVTIVQILKPKGYNSEHKQDEFASEQEDSDSKTDPDLAISSATIVPAISTSNPLNMCSVSFTEAGMLLESSDTIQQSLDSNSAIQLEDGTTAFVQNFEAVDESDSNDTTTKFIDGQAVQLEDGSTAFIHMAPREGLQAVQLEDGTMAYLSQTGADLFNGEASGLDLEQLASSQIGDNEEKELDIQMEEDFNQINSSRNIEKSFQCPYDGCHRLYTTLHHLKVHERSHTGDRPFKCTVTNCGKAFATGYGLKSHTRVHTGETPYKCHEELCMKAFKTSGDLQKHIRTHTGERPFKCPFTGCNRAFTTSNIRKVHIRTHTGERPYICKMEGCKRAFASATNYKNHIRIHTGEKPYVCSVSGCSKRFTEYSSLYKHHVVHTHSKPYICNVCGKNYRQTSTLAMHKRVVHGIFDNEDSAVKAIMAEDKNSDSEQRESSLLNIKQEVESEEKSEKFIVIKSANAEQETVATTLALGKHFPTVVTLQSDAASQILQEHPVYAVQLQQDGSSMQQILLVTDPSQLAALQQLAQQAQLEGMLTTTNGQSSLEES